MRALDAGGPGDGGRLPAGLEGQGGGTLRPVMNECATRMLRAALLMFTHAQQTDSSRSGRVWFLAYPYFLYLSDESSPPLSSTGRPSLPPCLLAAS